MITKDCLIIACSFAKRDPTTLPHVEAADGTPMARAIEVYDGNQFRVVRKWKPHIDLFILSAKYGILGPWDVIPLYNQKMRHNQHEDPSWVWLHVDEAWHLHTDGAPGKYGIIYHCMPRAYEYCLYPLANYGILRAVGPEQHTSQGQRLRALKEFCQARQGEGLPDWWPPSGQKMLTVRQGTMIFQQGKLC